MKGVDVEFFACGADCLGCFATRARRGAGSAAQLFDADQQRTWRLRSARNAAPGRQAANGSQWAICFQRPGKFRWTYEKPYEQLIVADGQRLVLFDKDLNQVTVKKLQASLPSSPASILFGSNEFEKEFDVSDAGARDGLEWIVAKPRAKDTTFERIEIGFRDGLPQAMLLADGFGQTTQLTFSKVERNPKLDADAFRFTPPKGADVLEDK